MEVDLIFKILEQMIFIYKIVMEENFYYIKIIPLIWNWETDH